jgi:hypothetical protein
MSTELCYVPAIIKHFWLFNFFEFLNFIFFLTMPDQNSINKPMNKEVLIIAYSNIP